MIKKALFFFLLITPFFLSAQTTFFDTGHAKIQQLRIGTIHVLGNLTANKPNGIMDVLAKDYSGETKEITAACEYLSKTYGDLEGVPGVFDPNETENAYSRRTYYEFKEGEFVFLYQIRIAYVGAEQKVKSIEFIDSEDIKGSEDLKKKAFEDLNKYRAFLAS